MIASITELRLKNLLSFLRFIPHAMKSKVQADQAKGIISVDVKSDGLLIQRTLTVWDSEQSMKNYVRSSPHLEAMKMFSKIANQSYTANFPVEAKPSWEEALEYLRKNGKAHGR